MSAAVLQKPEPDMGSVGMPNTEQCTDLAPFLTGEAGKVEPRRLHLGTDIWGPAGTSVMTPLEGRVHSFAFNNQSGDYGATIILKHELAGNSFFTLYGHLALKDIEECQVGDQLSAGTSPLHNWVNGMKPGDGLPIFIFRSFLILGNGR